MFRWNINNERIDFMAVKFDFSLMDSDFNKLRLLKKADGESNMTFNDYAEELLSRTIRRMYREYDENHYLRFEIAYHPEKNIDPSRKPVLHVHEYKPDDFSNRKARPLTKEEYEKYKKYFKGLV